MAIIRYATNTTALSLKDGHDYTLKAVQRTLREEDIGDNLGQTRHGGGCIIVNFDGAPLQGIITCHVFHKGEQGWMQPHAQFFSWKVSADKKALLLSTTGALGLKEVLDYLKLVASIWGFEVSHSVGIVTPPMLVQEKQDPQNDRKLKEAAFTFYNSLQKKRHSPTLKDTLIFRAQKATFDELGQSSPADYAYWKGKGWLSPEAKYYVNVPVNPLYNAIGWIFEQILRRKMRKEMVEVRR